MLIGADSGCVKIQPLGETFVPDAHQHSLCRQRTAARQSGLWRLNRASLPFQSLDHQAKATFRVCSSSKVRHRDRKLRAGRMIVDHDHFDTQSGQHHGGCQPGSPCPDDIADRGITGRLNSVSTLSAVRSSDKAGTWTSSISFTSEHDRSALPRRTDSRRDNFYNRWC